MLCTDLQQSVCFWVNYRCSDKSFPSGAGMLALQVRVYSRNVNKIAPAKNNIFLNSYNWKVIHEQ